MSKDYRIMDMISRRLLDTLMPIMVLCECDCYIIIFKNLTIFNYRTILSMFLSNVFESNVFWILKINRISNCIGFSQKLFY